MSSLLHVMISSRCFFFPKSPLLKNISNAWDGFRYFSGQHSSSQAKDGELQLFSNQVFPASKLSLRNLAAFIVFYLFRRSLTYWKHIASQRICSALGWMWMCVPVSSFFSARSFKFCLIILTKEECLILFSVALSGPCQKQPKQNNKTKKTQKPKPKKPQHQL